MTNTAALGVVSAGRAECPKCHRRGVGFAPHPHAYGYKDRGRLICRFCRARFTVRLVVCTPAADPAATPAGGLPR